jgi:hypothetical protein
MNARFKVVASYNILQYLCDFIHVLIFVIVSKCRKSLKLTNIVIHTLIRMAFNIHMISSVRLVVVHKFGK